MNNLAWKLRQLGRHGEAEQLQREVVEVRQRVLGPEHPDMLSARTCVAASPTRHGSPLRRQSSWCALPGTGEQGGMAGDNGQDAMQRRQMQFLTRVLQMVPQFCCWVVAELWWCTLVCPAAAQVQSEAQGSGGPGLRRPRAQAQVGG